MTVACVPACVEAAITSVTVNTTRDYEHGGGRGYTYAEITVHGTVARGDDSDGVYSVPAVLIYPRQGRGNRVGVVDWLNSAVYHFFPQTPEGATIQFTLNATGTYLFDEGYTYLSIQWNKFVTQKFGATAPADGQPHDHLVYGSIDRSADAWEILLDGARLLKDPRVYPATDGPARVSTVLSSGYSQGGALQLELLAEGLDPGRVYDGHLIQMIGLVCWKRNESPPHLGFLEPCRPLPTRGHHAPVIVLASETDMVAFHPSVLNLGKSAYFTRNRTNPNWRQYEMAGVAHIPEPILPLKRADQNSADGRPIFRAAFQNLTKWTHGTHREKPPESQYFHGRVGEQEKFVPITDVDGHFAGGVRLPHVQSAMFGWLIAGAPLGRHAPVNFAGFNPFDPFVILGGTFARFTDDELLERYPSRHVYIKRVTRAADSLAARGYITFEDRKALIRAARKEPLPSEP